MKSKTTRANNPRILPNWKKTKSQWSFSFRAVKNLNNCPQNIIKEADPKLRKSAVNSHVNYTTSFYLSICGSFRRPAVESDAPLSDVRFKDGQWLQRRLSRKGKGGGC